jgi:peptide/nickel transport system permease protein
VLGFLLRRLAASVLLLFLVLSLTFFLIHLAPGDPTNLVEGSRMTKEQRARLHHLYRLDRSLPEQYLAWLGAVALHGDWGISFSQQRPVTAVIADALPATVILAAAALSVEALASLGFGIAAARRNGSAFDHAVRVGSLVFNSQPPFWLGLMAVLLFAYLWPVFPAGQIRSIDADLLSPAGRLFDLLWHLALPALVLGLSNAGSTTLFMRGSLLDVMGRDFIRAARAKGLSERRVLWVHGLRNALTPIIQMLALSFSSLLNGTLITEVIFAWPGVGRLTFEAALTRDYPLILAATALSASMVALGNLLADLAHAAADPRVRDA